MLWLTILNRWSRYRKVIMGAETKVKKQYFSSLRSANYSSSAYSLQVIVITQ